MVDITVTRVDLHEFTPTLEEPKYELATRGQDMIAVRALTFPKVTIPKRGEGIGSTRAFRFRIYIEYTETV